MRARTEPGGWIPHHPTGAILITKTVSYQRQGERWVALPFALNGHQVMDGLEHAGRHYMVDELGPDRIVISWF